ncbi:hypothetical protein [Larkinella sp. C7]|nr:hypothetical protein [Larkinella sp. C7]
MAQRHTVFLYRKMADQLLQTLTAPEQSGAVSVFGGGQVVH